MTGLAKGIKVIVVDDKDKTWTFRFGHPDDPARLGYQMEVKQEYEQVASDYSILRNDVVGREMIIKIKY